MPQAPKPPSNQTQPDSFAFATDLVYILNYAPGQDPLFDLREQQSWNWLDSDSSPESLSGDQLAAALDAPIGYEPGAWQLIDSAGEMLTCRDILRPLLDAWLAAGSNIDEWTGVADLSNGLKQLSVRLFRAVDGSTCFRLVKPSEGSVNTAETWAVEYMFRYITSPFYTRIGRCERCKRYFFKGTKRGNQRFCPASKCGKNFHAVKQTKAGRDKDRQETLKRLRAAIAKFHKLSSNRRAKIAAAKGGVKKWLADGVYVGTRFINRALKRGELDLGGLGV